MVTSNKRGRVCEGVLYNRDRDIEIGSNKTNWSNNVTLESDVAYMLS